MLDNIIARKQYNLLTPLVLVGVRRHGDSGAHFVFATQLLSKEGQRLIAQLRRQVQEHVGRLPVAYYDATKSGALVSRIMSDVEGVPQPDRHGLGGVSPAAF